MELAPPIRDSANPEQTFALQIHEHLIEPQQRALFLAKTALGGGRVPTPVDPLTGLPLPIYPTWRKLNPKESKNNWHHHYHKSTDFRLTSQDGHAIRHSRVQLVPIPTHNRYHHIFEGPALPSTNHERFGHLVLVSAGYVPKVALDVYAEDPTEAVELSERKIRRLQLNGEIQLRGKENIGNFMRRYLVKQDVSHIGEEVIDEFLHTGNHDRKRWLGHLLLTAASEVAVEPIKPVYRQAMEEGLVIKAEQNLPKIVKKYISGPKTAERSIMGLHKNLSRRYIPATT